MAALGTIALVAGSSTPAFALGASLLGGLARPHPKFISGTPEGSSYFVKAHEYTADYSTERPDGSGRYPANSVSGYEVPKAAYPNGYVVSLRGGFVVSGTNDEELLIASARNAKNVHLVISPASPTP